ncbi:hypothetical protein [Streptomyces sp. DSM 40484]|uniref:hypothetical protein n=1 Tax=Streptomyces kroppenstedtii TaxID=3051181 RepID=UPI0028D4993A|nr:hypothetical protein [Streptomyces sp. DSM 40484]
MPNTEQPPDDELAARLREAQTAAFEWAQRAETEQQNAEGRTDYARANGESPYLREPVAAARRDATHYSARSSDASRLAEMWAHVALALTPLPAPANGQPATYDIQVLGPADSTALEDTLRQLKQRSGPGEPSP